MALALPTALPTSGKVAFMSRKASLSLSDSLCAGVYVLEVFDRLAAVEVVEELQAPAPLYSQCRSHRLSVELDTERNLGRELVFPAPRSGIPFGRPTLDAVVLAACLALAPSPIYYPYCKRITLHWALDLPFEPLLLQVCPGSLEHPLGIKGLWGRQGRIAPLCLKAL